MKKENRLYNWIKENTKNIYLIKIEHSLTVGIPDLMTILGGVNRVKDNDLKLLKLGAWGFSHIITQPKTRDGLEKILDAIKNY
jgi:hypothetical protein